MASLLNPIRFVTMLSPSWLFLAVMSLVSVIRAVEPVHFSREILPILSENCLSCHGQDEKHRKADLRLDTLAGATAVHDGVSAVMPGKPELSELVTRIVTEDKEELMPPPSSHKPRLKSVEVDLLKRWIAEGAVWGKHWAYEKPVRVAGTADFNHAEEQGSPTHFSLSSEIDRFVWRRLQKEKLQPSAAADRHTLLRRVSFDLTGLPPTPDELAAFDGSTASYAAVVDRLLASRHFGERMAMWWLDAARYADTDGFQSDSNRENWPWRDWVVEAFNSNMRFDQFTLEQFAGDLLPNATPEQKLATSFHRHHMTNGEGGRDPEESRVD